MAKEHKSTQPKSKTYQSQLLLENVKDIFLDSTTADVHFTFDSVDFSVVRVPAHKILLAASSPIFKRMFYGELKENGDVNVVDVSDAAFKEFLQYFYLSDVKLTEENIAGVIYLGHKYDVKKCVEDCVQFLMDTLSGDSVCTALSTGIIYNHDVLMKACETFIISNTGAVFKAASFLKCEKEVLAHILQLNILSCSEVDVFHACMAWVKYKSGRDSLAKETVDRHLGGLYYEIRYASMTMEHVCDLLSKYRSVLSNDFETIANIIVTPGFDTNRFKTSARQPKWDEANIVKCDLSTQCSEEYAHALPLEHIIVFSTNKPLLLGSFVCGKVFSYPRNDLRSGLSVDVEIAEYDDSSLTNFKCLLRMRAQLQSKDVEVLLPHPILIRPGFDYKISIGKFPAGHGFFPKKMKMETVLESGEKINFHLCQMAEDSRKIIGNNFVSALNFNKI